MSFSPSGYSGSNIAIPNRTEIQYETLTSADQASIAASQAKSASWTAAIEGISALAVTGIQMGAQVSALKKTQAHEMEMAAQQESLLGLQTQASMAQTAANKAAASIQALAASKTLLIVGGVVITVGLIGAMVMTMKRRDDDYDDYEDDDYEDEYY
jgi:uncharacterized membrane protein